MFNYFYELVFVDENRFENNKVSMRYSDNLNEFASWKNNELGLQVVGI